MLAGFVHRMKINTFVSLMSEEIRLNTDTIRYNAPKRGLA
jgi:hypothetical protein